MSALAAGAVARVKESASYTGKWGTNEHLACLRYMVIDAIAQATDGKELPNRAGRPALDKAGKPLVDKDGKPVVVTLAKAVNAILKAAFDADPELGYASNFDKLLKKMGEIPEGNEYE